MGDRHKAPRSEVLSIRRVGSYGTTVWEHQLECGHVEQRKRRSPKPRIGCKTCKQNESLLINIIRNEDEPGESMAIELEVLRMTAGIANALGVPQEAVTVNVSAEMGRPTIAGAMVWLHRQAAENVAHRLDKHQASDKVTDK